MTLKREGFTISTERRDLRDNSKEGTHLAKADISVMKICSTSSLEAVVEEVEGSNSISNKVEINSINSKKRNYSRIQM